MIRIDQIKTSALETLDRNKIARFLHVPADQVKHFEIIRRSLDARRGHVPQYVYVVDVELKSCQKLRKMPQGVHIIEKKPVPATPDLSALLGEHHRPVVVGFGPAGMFCALTLARAGLKPIVLERGEPVEERTKKVQTFWQTGRLDTNSNVQFGEGGAGTFSDGKLNTLIKDKDQIGRRILKEMVRAGAPEEILYEAKPHIGTDKLRDMVRHIREEILSLGGEVRFGSRLEELVMENGALKGARLADGSLVPAEALFLCIGHSARDTFEMLKKAGIPMQAKAFAMGVRVEHLQAWINEARYHEYADKLGPADYKVTHTASNGRGIYSFCMCPGGVVAASASEEGCLVTNGMSYYARDGVNANSALIVTVTPEDYVSYALGENDVLAGMRFQRDLEEKAFVLGGRNYHAPVQRVEDFHLRRASTGFGVVEPTFTGGVNPADLWEILPPYMSEALDEGLRAFDHKIHGFDHPDALLTGIESRTSSPVRILRDEASGQSVVRGLYPVGEGAGYAGGIMSAAIDGLRAAERYMASIQG